MSLLKPVLTALIALSISLTITAPAMSVDTGMGATVKKSAYQTAQSQIKSRQYKNAIRTLKQLVVDEPGNADAWNLYAYASRKNGQFKNAGKFYKTALKLDPKHLGALEYQGELFLETGQPKKARENLAAIKAICGTCSELRELARAIRKAESS